MYVSNETGDIYKSSVPKTIIKENKIILDFNIGEFVSSDNLDRLISTNFYFYDEAENKRCSFDKESIQSAKIRHNIDLTSTVTISLLKRSVDDNES